MMGFFVAFLDHHPLAIDHRHRTSVFGDHTTRKHDALPSWVRILDGLIGLDPFGLGS